MKQLGCFVGNPNDCVRGILATKGIRVTATLLFGEVEYKGAWVSPKCAKKLFASCCRSGDASREHNHAFDLFHVNLMGQVTKIEPTMMAGYLGMPNNAKRKNASPEPTSASFTREMKVRALA